jgi:threonine aldolase
MMAEAVIVFDKALAEVVRIRHKRAGFLHSKMRYFAAQLIAYVEGGLWLENARSANGTAQRIAERLAATPGITLAHPVEANQIFVHIAATPYKALRDKDIELRSWGAPGAGLYRLVTSYCDPEDLIVRLESVLGVSPATTQKRP